MRSSVLFAAFFASASLSQAALTLTFPATQTFTLPETGSVRIGIVGQLVASHLYSSVSLLAASATGPGGTISGASLNDLVGTSGSTSMTFDGVLFSLPITSLTLPGHYSGFTQMRVTKGATRSTSSSTAFAFDLVRPQPVPEPGSFAALALGGVALVRRRRR